MTAPFFSSDTVCTHWWPGGCWVGSGGQGEPRQCHARNNAAHNLTPGLAASTAAHTSPANSPQQKKKHATCTVDVHFKTPTCCQKLLHQNLQEFTRHTSVTHAQWALRLLLLRLAAICSCSC